INLNESLIETQDNSLDINLTIEVSADLPGTVTLLNLSHVYLGDHNVSITSNVYDKTSGVLYETITSQVLWRYSPFLDSLPTRIDYYDVFPSSYNDKDVQPYGQKDGKPISNYTTTAKTDSIDITACLNETIDACLDIVWSPNFNQTNGSDITSTQNCTSIINVTSDLTNTSSFGIYNFWNLTDCTTNAFKFLEYNIVYNSWCSDCVRVS
ncbi:unnamed protein product, partial [marine sediment metagenome]